VWRQTGLNEGRYRNDAGLGTRDGARSRSTLSAIDRGIQRQEGLRTGSSSGMSVPRFSSPSASGSSSYSEKTTRSPNAGKKGREQ